MKPTLAPFLLALVVVLPACLMLRADPQTDSQHNKEATAALQSARRPSLKLFGVIKAVLSEGVIVQSRVKDEGDAPAGPRPSISSEVHGTILLRNYLSDEKVGMYVTSDVSPDGTWTDKDGKVYQAYRSKASN
jgi:hypothetical protein